MLELCISFDTTVYNWFFQMRGEKLTAFFSFVTEFGNWKVVLFALLCATALLYFRNKKHTYTLPVWFSFLSASSITYLLKILYARPRPLEGLAFEESFSFPSMHATVAVVVYGLLIFLIVKNVRPHFEKIIFVTLGLMLIVAIGTSRLYLGVHYASDVLAGYLVGAVGVFLGMYLHRRFATKAFM